MNILRRHFNLCILLFLVLPALHAQPPVKAYTIKDGKMHISLSKKINDAALDSFINKYALADIGLKQFINTGKQDSLLKSGWIITDMPEGMVTITKNMDGPDMINNPADKIVLTQSEQLAARFAPSGAGILFGYNRFKNKYPFAVTDSFVTFFLRGFLNAQKVNLAGSFNNWQPAALSMNKTDSGWVATVKLSAGKYWYKFIADGNWMIDKDNQNVENDGEGNDNSVYYKTNYTFTLQGYTNVKKVFIAGSFNNWNDGQLRMQPTAGGWQLPVYISNGTHTYRYIVNDKWMEDPGNQNKLPNEFNEYNSVLQIGQPYLFKLDGYSNAQKIVLLGSFNQWKDNELFMQKTVTGWQLPYTLGPGNYQYRLKIDGQLTADSTTGENLVLIIDANYTFRLKGYDRAKKVFVAGDFNNWDPASFLMKREGDEWVYRVHLDKGKHLYKFIADGKWMLDPYNKLWQGNEHNTGNSIVWVSNN